MPFNRHGICLDCGTMTPMWLSDRMARRKFRSQLQDNPLYLFGRRDLVLRSVLALLRGLKPKARNSNRLFFAMVRRRSNFFGPGLMAQRPALFPLPRKTLARPRL